MTFDEWLAQVPSEITSDSLWKMEAYRLGLFAADLAWKDAAKLAKEPRTRSMADQLCRAAGNISSNIGEGYSLGTGKNRSRFYEYALGSSRECRDWYFKARHALGPNVAEHRIQFVTQLIKLLIRMTANERRANQRLSTAKSRTNHQSPVP